MTLYDAWEARYAAFLDHCTPGDAAHDRAHIHRVVANAKRLAASEQANLAVVVPAAWLHDCIAVAKDSPLRAQASRMAAEAAGQFLRDAGYDPTLIPDIEHAIAAHSFTAAIPPETLEAKVVQDADRLDSLGAIGVARCLMLNGSMGRPLYNEHDPFAHHRVPDDTTNAIDHFYVKFLRLVDLLQTPSGKREGERRLAFMYAFLHQLGANIAGAARPEAQ